LNHDKDTIYTVSAKLKEVVGIVDHLAVLERESFDVLFSEEFKD